MGMEKEKRGQEASKERIKNLNQPEEDKMKE